MSNAAGVRALWEFAITGNYFGANDLGTAEFPLNIRAAHRFVQGTGSGAANAATANRLYGDTRQIAASGTDALDLQGGLVDLFQKLFVVARVKGLYVRAHITNTNNVVIGGGSNPWLGPMGASGTVSLLPGAVFAVFDVGDGWPVTANTGDILQIANSSSGSVVDYDIMILGSTT